LLDRKFVKEMDDAAKPEKMIKLALAKKPETMRV
jgi:hypothetical protein